MSTMQRVAVIIVIVGLGILTWSVICIFIDRHYERINQNELKAAHRRAVLDQVATPARKR